MLTLDTEFWRTFIPQILAALVGAGVGVFGVLLGFALQRKAARSDEVDAASERVLGRLDELSMALYERLERGSTTTIVSTDAVMIALFALQIRSHGRDRRMATRLRQAWVGVAKSTEGDEAHKKACVALGYAITSWRLGDMPDARTRIADVELAAAGKPTDEAARPLMSPPAIVR